mmetsp:Transcript_6883/g.8986  ORF Transcript_6883/g.8986 Transcript_6883/m.8986 type:complete len:115 (-) Transcript_6883:90-434(-)|eukprot:CAMPEP_0195282550 /NCGR_PEP_ID=MMETSP0707-20130614/1367_1 /TAXON_ID=33640 /ORGANISM="Asterionellopsis glacialis, Strain CCMP134" /LENGTH=114 /DNA_ID=CAMNT_0040341525 /DNA_START=227 /DNA_END=568 /DNA_ORIENTATION=-
MNIYRTTFAVNQGTKRLNASKHIPALATNNQVYLSRKANSQPSRSFTGLLPDFKPFKKISNLSFRRGFQSEDVAQSLAAASRSAGTTMEELHQLRQKEDIEDDIRTGDCPLTGW